MNRDKLQQTFVFLAGGILGTAIGLALVTLFTPYSGEETRNRIKTQSGALRNRAIAEGDDFAHRIRHATDNWVSQLRTIADDLVAQGKLTTDEARIQIDELLHKMRS